MDDWGDFYALLLIWLGFVTLVAFYVVRIASLLREQWLNERAYRFRLAARRGRAIREASREVDATR